MAEAKKEGSSPKAGSIAYYQGKPVLVGENGAVYALPAPQFVDPEAITDSPEEYDAGAEAESATTAETSGVTSQSV